MAMHRGRWLASYRYNGAARTHCASPDCRVEAFPGRRLGAHGRYPREMRGLAAGSTSPCVLGPDLSRGFRALKTWFTLKTYGTEKLGAIITRTCELASYLEARILPEPRLELLAPVALNIVCFRFRADD